MSVHLVCFENATDQPMSGILRNQLVGFNRDSGKNLVRKVRSADAGSPEHKCYNRNSVSCHPSCVLQSTYIHYHEAEAGTLLEKYHWSKKMFQPRSAVQPPR